MFTVIFAVVRRHGNAATFFLFFFIFYSKYSIPICFEQKHHVIARFTRFSICNHKMGRHRMVCTTVSACVVASSSVVMAAQPGVMGFVITRGKIGTERRSDVIPVF